MKVLKLYQNPSKTQFWKKNGLSAFLHFNSSYIQSVYHDLSQINMASLTSLDELNTRLEKKVTMRNFRPNLIVGDVNNAWDEVSQIIYWDLCLECIITQ